MFPIAPTKLMFHWRLHQIRFGDYICRGELRRLSSGYLLTSIFNCIYNLFIYCMHTLSYTLWITLYNETVVAYVPISIICVRYMITKSYIVNIVSCRQQTIGMYQCSYCIYSEVTPYNTDSTYLHITCPTGVADLFFKYHVCIGCDSKHVDLVRYMVLVTICLDIWSHV